MDFSRLDGTDRATGGEAMLASRAGPGLRVGLSLALPRGLEVLDRGSVRLMSYVDPSPAVTLGVDGVLLARRAWQLKAGAGASLEAPRRCTGGSPSA